MSISSQPLIAAAQYGISPSEWKFAQPTVVGCSVAMTLFGVMGAVYAGRNGNMTGLAIGVSTAVTGAAIPGLAELFSRCCCGRRFFICTTPETVQLNI